MTGSVIVCLIALALCVALCVLDGALGRWWRREAADAQRTLEWAKNELTDAGAARDEATAHLSDALGILQLAVEWNEHADTKLERWHLMGAAERERVLARERALWAATEHALTETEEAP